MSLFIIWIYFRVQKSSWTDSWTGALSSLNWEWVHRRLHRNRVCLPHLYTVDSKKAQFSHNKQIILFLHTEEEASKALKTLRSSKAPLVKKRQVMRAMTGDYRKKMEDEKKKQYKLIQSGEHDCSRRTVSTLTFDQVAWSLVKCI